MLISLLVLSGCEGVGPAHSAPAVLSTCRPSTPLLTISGAVERANALPVSSPSCFLASLARPLDVVASTSITSAQPAVGRESPRLFLIDRALAISFVPAGDGAPLVEFGEWVTPTRTLKAELALPLTAPLTADEPFTRVHFGATGTSCGLCHREEAPHPSIPGAYVSLAFRPSTRTLVPFSELTAAHDACTRDEDASERCLMFHALFDFGVVRPGAFSAEVPLFTE